MANQLKMADVQAILSLHAQGWSYRAIAERLGMHRETVSRRVRLAAGNPKPAILHAGILPDDAPAGDSKPAILHGAPGSSGAALAVTSAGQSDEESKPAKMHAGNEAKSRKSKSAPADTAPEIPAAETCEK